MNNINTGDKDVCPLCQGRSTEHLEGGTHECYDCGETYESQTGLPLNHSRNCPICTPSRAHMPKVVKTECAGCGFIIKPQSYKRFDTVNRYYCNTRLGG